MTDARESREGDRRPDAAPGMPRWVKLGALVGVVLLVLVVLMLLTGHGPGRHMSSGAGAPVAIEFALA